MPKIVLNVPEPKKKRRGPGNPDKTIPYRFKPGQSGNPGGKPKLGNKSISNAYAHILEQEIPDFWKRKFNIEGPCTWANLIALQAVQQAVQPKQDLIHMPAITELRETTEGKTPDKVEATGRDGAPLQGPTFQVQFTKPKEQEAGPDK